MDPDPIIEIISDVGVVIGCVLVVSCACWRYRQITRSGGSWSLTALLRVPDGAVEEGGRRGERAEMVEKREEGRERRQVTKK